MGGRCSLACTVHHPLRYAMQLQSAPSSRRNNSFSAPAVHTGNVTRSVTSYQAASNAEEIIMKPFNEIDI
ncbi:unnamed protein product, partial [Iphiclides podalirius]